jgi:hypothetical protein
MAYYTTADELIAGVNAGNNGEELVILDFSDEVQADHNLRRVEMQKLADYFKKNPQIQRLRLYGQNLSDADIVMLADAVQNSTHLVSLILDDNKISDVGANAIAQFLNGNKILRELRMENNNIGDVGLVNLAAALQHNNTLTKLCLNENRFKDVGVIALAQALKVNGSLNEVLLQNNDIRDAGAVKLVEALKINKSIKILQVDTPQHSQLCKISLKNRNCITDLLIINRELPIAIADVITKTTEKIAKFNMVAQSPSFSRDIKSRLALDGAIPKMPVKRNGLEKQLNSMTDGVYEEVHQVSDLLNIVSENPHERRMDALSVLSKNAKAELGENIKMVLGERANAWRNAKSYRQI